MITLRGMTWNHPRGIDPLVAHAREYEARHGVRIEWDARSLEDFEAGWMAKVDSATTVIILGDGRGNRTQPRVDIVQRLAERSRQVIWLNPEHPASWGTGDSDMLRYAPHCRVVSQCSTLRQLERVVSDMLRNHAG